MAPQSPAHNLLAKADKKLASGGGWFSSKSSKFEEAGDLYQQAANQFKIDKDFKNSGDSFSKEAECRENGGEPNEAANAWWNAAKSYKQVDPRLAINALEQTITFLTKAGRFRQAADREKEIAQIYLNLDPTPDRSKARESFSRAGEWYEQEDAHATANACHKDAADLHVQLDEYNEAILLYEKVAKHSLQSNLTRYSAKEYYLRACICALALKDPVLARRKLTAYSADDGTFPTTREAKFVVSIIEAVEAGDVEAYTASLVEYDSVTKFDKWKTEVLLKVKRTIAEEDPLT